MASSAIPAAKSGLLELLQDSLDGVSVTWGRPAGELPREWVLVGRVEGDQEWAPMGRRAREERFTISVYISVVQGGPQQQAASERAFAILALAEAALRTDVQLGGAVRTAEIRHLTLDERPSGQGREAQLTVGIYCTARI